MSLPDKPCVPSRASRSIQLPKAPSLTPRSRATPWATDFPVSSTSGPPHHGTRDRNVVERALAHLKQWRDIATRYDMNRL